MIVAYGGCPVDEPGRSLPRLPLEATEKLFVRIRGLLQSLQPAQLVGSLTPGADILFARAALAERVPLGILLPCDAATFRETTVVPAGEPWLSHFDRITTTSGVTIDSAGLDLADDGVQRRHNVALLDAVQQRTGDCEERVWLFTIRPTPLPSSPTDVDELVLRAEERGMLAVDFDPMPGATRRAFIVMPYGKKKDPRANRFLECDPAFHRVYRPLLEDLDVEWVRADLQTDSGIIHSAMLSDLANSDLVLADLSAINFNVAYELGIRHVFASRATVLINPSIASFKQTTPPFDVNMIRTHSFVRGADAVTDEQAEAAIRGLLPVVCTALDGGQSDSPCHQWFDLGNIVRPFQPRAAVPTYRVAGKEVRDRVAEAIRSADVDEMRKAAGDLESNREILVSARRACRIELAAAMMDEKAYDDARVLLELAKPTPEDPLHRTWLHHTVMAYRRLGERATVPSVQEQLWDTAKQYLVIAEDAGYRDSETYGIWGGLLKRQLERQRGRMDDATARGLFAEMEQRYRLGFDLDPEYYTGVNVVMALRWSGRVRDDEYRRDFNEVLTVSRFLARQALAEDPGDFWAAVTLAELALHEALELRTLPLEEAIRLYAAAARTGRPDEVDSARFQLEFLRICGDPSDVIDRVIEVLGQAAEEGGRTQ
ncbi:tetratricopeptide repeat-containing protein [Mycolicibacterium litorale]|uniref:tetratricopeptide repeat-containing protein n=1 Tax=Mycolicibacterium litorale TaxID=758802 RepID=UPI003CE6E58C